jgi:hypothetical protein
MPIRGGAVYQLPGVNIGDREIEYAFDADDAIGLPRGPIGPDAE